jgi:hypothetical protein
MFVRGGSAPLESVRQTTPPCSLPLTPAGSVTGLLQVLRVILDIVQPLL